MTRSVAVAALLALVPLAARADTPCPAPSSTPNPHPIAVVAPKATLALRVANTWSLREYGLMCVRDLPPHTGMVFVFSDGDQRRSFWMKNTLVPLDMVFVKKNGAVDTVAANVPSTTTDTAELDIPWRYGVGQYVIELPAGDAERDGIVRGTHLDLRAAGTSKD